MLKYIVIVFTALALKVILATPKVLEYKDPLKSGINIWMTIGAKHRTVEVSWINARMHTGDVILITNGKTDFFQKVSLSDHGMGVEGSGSDLDSTIISIGGNEGWKTSDSAIEIVGAIQPQEPSQWVATNIKFNLEFSKDITKETDCYAYWANYIDKNGEIISTGCIRAYPRWMNDMKSVVGQFRIRDLMIPGSHDSGSYRLNFDPDRNETLVTKYALTQDDDIRSQLMHGIRYLDIRVGYYRKTEEQFFINHGITKQVPLNDVVNQVIDFVLETNEIVIFDIQEFPIGFGKDLTIHRKLVSYLRGKFGHLLVDPSLSWQTLLSTVWQRKQNIFLSYDNFAVVSEFSNTLFPPCDQRWGNKRKWADLEKYLRRMHTYDALRLSSRPVSDMAELTPDSWGVISDKYGGLRKMADSMNWLVTKLYREDLGKTSNIVSCDFYRGTNIVDLSIYYNYRKVIL